MNTSVFAVDFFDPPLWENKIEFARKHEKGFFWGIFGSCLEEPHDEPDRIFVFTLRQWRKLLSVTGPAESNDVKYGIQRLLKIKSKFCIKTISFKLCCVIVLKNKIEVRFVQLQEGNSDYFLKQDIFKDFEDNDDFYKSMELKDFLRQGLRTKIYGNVPRKAPFWLYYFSSQKRPDDSGSGIKYCPVGTNCPWTKFLEYMQNMSKTV